LLRSEERARLTKPPPMRRCGWKEWMKSVLTGLDRRFLETIIRYYKGGPVGLEAIAATLQEEADTLVD